MNTHQGVSKPILVFTLAAVTVCVLLLWLGRSHPEPRADETGAVASEQTSAASVTTNSADATQSPAAVMPVSGELPPVIPISLANVPVSGGEWMTKKAFLSLPTGTQNFGGIAFWLDGVIELQSSSLDDDGKNYGIKSVPLPLLQTNYSGEKMEVVQLGSNVSSIHLVGATRLEGEGDMAIADLVWRYADKTSRRTTIRYQNHVRDWIRAQYETPASLPYVFSKVVWRMKHPGGKQGQMLRLYRFSYANPAPEKTVRELEFVSATQVPHLFVVGVTLDPVKLGQRPDDSPNLEPTDATPPNTMGILVQNGQGQAIPGAKVGLRIKTERQNYGSRFERYAMTDNYGMARINYPSAKDADGLEVSAAHDDYASRKMVWSPRGGDTIPESYTMKLSPGLTIGGVVVDSGDNPIASARLLLYRSWNGGEEMNQKGEQMDFSWRNLGTTDAQGVWQAKGLSTELLGHLLLDTKHADYIGTQITLEANGETEKQLRAGTFKVKLGQGLSVRGKVVDNSARPVSGAKVSVGRRYSNERQETKTDEYGQFKTSAAQTGSVPVTVMAKGYQPTITNVLVKAEMEPVLIMVQPGSVIRGLVHDEAGEPIADVRLALDGNSSSGRALADAVDFSTTTDAKGRFVWDGAPDEPVSFYVGKQGYEQKRGVMLKPNQDNLVTLRKGRKVEGWVLDATTEKPVSKFRVGVGSYQNLEYFHSDYPGPKEFANGTFTLTIDDEGKNGIKAEADDYAAKVEKLPEAQNGVIQVVLRLTPSPALRGVVLSADGSPVAGATVAFSTGTGATSLSLRNGRLSSYQGKIVTTDASGAFTLPSPPESGSVVGAAETGFAMASIQQVRASGQLVLQTFGRIEGRFTVGGQGVQGQEFTYSMMNAGLMFDFGSYKATTDADGRFTIDKLPAGTGQIVRLVKTGPMWMHSHNTDVVVESGKTTQVTLGDTGALLKGHVSFESPPPEGENYSIGGNLNTAMPTRQNFQSSADAQAYYSSPEWREQAKQMKHFAMVVNADGTFVLDSVPAGNYTLNVTATKAGSQPWETKPVAQGQINVIVPENTSPFTPIQLEEVYLKLVSQRK